MNEQNMFPEARDSPWCGNSKWLPAMHCAGGYLRQQLVPNNDVFPTLHMRTHRQMQWRFGPALSWSDGSTEMAPGGHCAWWHQCAVWHNDVIHMAAPYLLVKEDIAITTEPEHPAEHTDKIKTILPIRYRFHQARWVPAIGSQYGILCHIFQTQGCTQS